MLVALLLWMSPASAQSLELGHDYVIAASDRLAMGGAGIALARGVSGTALVPGVMSRRKLGREDREDREPRERKERVVVLDGVARPAALGWSGSDLPNLGGPDFRGRLGMLGGGILVDRVGIVALGTLTQVYPADQPPEGLFPDGESPTLEMGELCSVVALSSADGRAHLGLGAQINIGEAVRPGASASWTTVAPLLGLFLDLPPPGLTMAISMRYVGRDGNTGIRSRVEEAVMPAQGAVGLAWASVAGPDPLRRHPTRLAFDLVVTGPVRDGISAEAWLLGEERTRGARVSVEPRAGMEYELWPNRVQLRAGSYLEPARNEGSEPRLHGTGGLEVHVLDIPLFGRSWPIALRTAADVAERYHQIQLIGLHFWHDGPLPLPAG